MIAIFLYCTIVKLLVARITHFWLNANFLFELHMVIFLDGDNVTWTSYTPIDHVQWQISNQGLHGRNLFFRYFYGVGT